MKTYKMYVGGYSSEDASIYQIEYYPNNKEFKILSTNNESINPVHLLIKDNFLLTANDIDEVARISSFEILKQGNLKLVNRIDGVGNKTRHLTIGDNVIYGANYGSGNVFSVPLEADGDLIEVMSNMEHVGSEPRAHSTVLAKNKKYLYEANLGLDRIFHYEVYPEGILRTHSVKSSTKLADFEGPRQMVIDESGQYLYIINEYGNSIYSFLIDDENGLLTFVEKIKLVDKVESYAADIKFGYQDQYLYASLRGPNQIVQISVSQGQMKVIAKFTTGGKWPCGFEISPDGKYMFIANRNSNYLTVLEINLNDGSLSPPLAGLEIFRPTSIAIYNK